jgi:hypothetical protein
MEPLFSIASEWPMDPTQVAVPFDCVRSSESGPTPYWARVLFSTVSKAFIQESPLHEVGTVGVGTAVGTLVAVGTAVLVGNGVSVGTGVFVATGT